MKLVKTRALVLRSRPFGEKDRLLTLLSLELGKLGAKAPGARNVKSKLAAGVEPFTCASYLLHRGKSLFTISQLELVTSYANIRGNIHSYALALYFSELVEKTVEEGEACPQIYNLLTQCWSLLHEQRGDKDILARYFELQMLNLLGYQPHFDNCIFCGRSRGPFFWNESTAGIFCRDCAPEPYPYPLASGTLALLRSFIFLGPGKVVNLRAPEGQKKELQKILQHLLLYWTGSGPFKSLQFLQKVRP